MKAIGKELDKKKDPEGEYLSHSSKSNRSDNEVESNDINDDKQAPPKKLVKKNVKKHINGGNSNQIAGADAEFIDVPPLPPRKDP